MDLDYSPIPNDDGVPAGVIAIVVETTDRVLAQHWQAGEHDRMRQFFDQSPGFMSIMIGPDHIVDHTNAAHNRLIGNRDVLGKSLREAIPEIEAQGFLDLLDTVYRTGKPYSGLSLRAALSHPDNRTEDERFIDLSLEPLRDHGGAIIGVIAQGHDVTDRVNAERALREREAQFRFLAEALPNHVWVSAPNGSLTWVNSRVCDYAGLSEESLLNDGWASIVHADDIARVAEAWNHALDTGTPYDTEFRLRRRDGSYRWHLARAVAARNADDAITHWIGTNTDIEDQKRIAQALTESEQRLRISQNAGGIASLELEIASGTVKGSDRFWSIWGLSQRDSIHISDLEKIVVTADRHVRSTEETRVAGTAVPSVEYRVRRPDTGELRWLSRTIEFVRDRNGKPIKIFGVMQDITERKEAQSRQELLVYELEHRIKNILAMVSAIAAQTLRNGDLETARETFRERLAALGKAHDILNKTRWTKASLHEVIASSITVVQGDRISVDGPPLPINPKAALSMALAVNELATNALKYGALSTTSGRVDIRWSVEPQQSDDKPSFRWTWQESGGPKVTPPKRRGFGSLLLQRVFATDFNGKVQIDYHPNGVVCVLQSAMPTVGGPTL
jgi:PAS domain S-box-containing protein